MWSSAAVYESVLGTSKTSHQLHTTVSSTYVTQTHTERGDSGKREGGDREGGKREGGGQSKCGGNRVGIGYSLPDNKGNVVTNMSLW